MATNENCYSVERLVRLAILTLVGLFSAVALTGLVLLLRYLSDVLIPFALAFILAYLMNPLVTLMQRRIRNRIMAVLASLALVLIALAIVGAVLIPIIMGEIGHMGGLVADMVRDSQLAQEASKRLPPDLWQAIRNYASSEKVQEFLSRESFWQMAGGAAEKVLPGAWQVLKHTGRFLLWVTGLMVILLYLVFLLVDFPRAREAWKDLLPVRYREPAAAFVCEVRDAMNRYFRAQAAVAGTVGVLFAIGFGIIGLPMGVLLGLFIGLLNMVPYLQIVGLVPAVFLAFMHSLETGQSFWLVLGLVGLVFAVVQTIQDTILVPRIMGKAMGLSPAMILLSLSIWGKLLGLLGLLIALPSTCLLLAYYRRLLAAHEKNGEKDPPSPLPS